MKVLIADDETMICEWLQFCISQNPACELVGVAHNGREALELAGREAPDLILTDIKMPVMDGLELLHALREAGSRVRVVVLTAFAEFDLARQALRDGASEYILKTEMKNEMLQELLDRVNRELNLSGAASGIANSPQAHSIIRRILRQERDLTSEDLEELRRCGVHWRDNGLFALAVWKKDLMNGGLSFPREEQIRHVAGFDYTDRIYVVVGNLLRALSSGEKARKLTAYAKEVQAMNHCMVGVSSVTDELRQIPSLVFQAACTLGQGFYRGEVALYEPSQPLSRLFELHRGWKSEMAGLRVQLYQADGARRRELLEQFLQQISTDRIPAVDLLGKWFLDAFDLFALQAREQGAELPEQDALRARLAGSVSLREVREILGQVSELCRETDEPHRPRSNNIRLAVEYLRKHYAEPLSLEQVAAQVYLNPDYFSRAFKEEMGLTFVNYLTDLRMQHSVQLLENTALRVQNIAQSVGYANVSYFSTLFKKKYGMSPYEYRRKDD